MLMMILPKGYQLTAEKFITVSKLSCANWPSFFQQNLVEYGQADILNFKM